jgi:hypothetical protein
MATVVLERTSAVSAFKMGPMSRATRREDHRGPDFKNWGLKLLLLHSQQPSAVLETSGARALPGPAGRRDLSPSRASWLPPSRRHGGVRIAWGRQGDRGLTRQAVYRIQDHPAGAEAALAAWGL